MFGVPLLIEIRQPLSDVVTYLIIACSCILGSLGGTLSKEGLIRYIGVDNVYIYTYIIMCGCEKEVGLGLPWQSLDPNNAQVKLHVNCP